MVVIETPEFLAAARKLKSDEERARLVDYLAHENELGSVCDFAAPPQDLLRRLMIPEDDRQMGSGRALRLELALFPMPERHEAG